MAVLLASSVLVTAAGVAIGGVVQDRLAAEPTPTQTRALETIDSRPVVVPKPADEAKRGPNRADLGGGRASLGADR